MMLDTWSYHAKAGQTSMVMPDGCRDLIYSYPSSGRPRWFISPLHDGPTPVHLAAGTCLVGYRLQPGVQLDDARLLRGLATRPPDAVDIEDRIGTSARVDPFVESALVALRASGAAVSTVAGQVGVSPRTLHRRLVAATGRTPVYWMQLARARRTARSLLRADDLASVAVDLGYADQAHMSRSLRQWFGVTPRTLTAPSDLTPVLSASGYG